MIQFILLIMVLLPNDHVGTYTEHPFQSRSSCNKVLKAIAKDLENKGEFVVFAECKELPVDA